MSRAPVRRPPRGFTLVGVLLLVAILAVVVAATVTAGVALQRRAAEEELLFVGHEYRAAFKSYYESALGTQRFPNRLEDLLKDPRFPGTRRHLRKIYADPLSGKAEWGMMPAPGGGIMGVYSLSGDVPIKQAMFPLEFADFEGKQKYSEWVFAYVGTIAPPGSAQPAGAASSPPLTAGGPAVSATPPASGPATSPAPPPQSP